MNIQKFEQLIQEGYSLDYIAILNFIKEKCNINTDIPKLSSIIQFLERKELIVEGKLSIKGKELLEYYEKEGEIDSKAIFKPKEDLFDVWWTIYPISNLFEFKGKKFPGIQSKRTKKEECKLLFNKILNEGEYTAKQIIEATEAHINMAKEISYKKGENQLSYITNSERYLRTRAFIPYIGMKKETSEELTNFTNI